MDSPAGPIYLDTSALIKLHLPEPESDDLDRVLRGRRDVQISDLAVTELTSGVARRKRDGELSAELAGELHRTLLDHVSAGHYIRAICNAETHRAAERLLLSLEAAPLRSADSLHLALALSHGARTLATFDRRLQAAAPTLGLALLPA